MAKRKMATESTLENYEGLLEHYLERFEGGDEAAEELVCGLWEAIGETEQDIAERGTKGTGARKVAEEPWLTLLGDVLAGKPGSYHAAAREREAREAEAAREASEISWEAISEALAVAEARLDAEEEAEALANAEPTKREGETWGEFGARRKAWKEARLA